MYVMLPSKNLKRCLHVDISLFLKFRVAKNFRCELVLKVGARRVSHNDTPTQGLLLLASRSFLQARFNDF